MSIQKEIIKKLLLLLNRYPSPHNGQPVRLQRIDDNTFDIYFDKNRGLQSTEISYIFSFVSIGVFIEHMQLSAQALGHSVAYQLTLPSREELRGKGLVKVGSCRFEWNTQRPNEIMYSTLMFRQTSRKKYFQGVDERLVSQMTEIATDKGMSLTKLNLDQAKQAIWLNQRAIFDDMFDEAVRKELDHWLRYSKAEKISKGDGLAYDCMEMNGKVIKYIVSHPQILQAPIINKFIQQYYLRTMKDKSDVLYMMAPFATEQDAFEVGVAIMKLWFIVAEQGYYLHPFGTIMSNEQAHADFLKLAQVSKESVRTNYLVFIFRCGKSESPVPSFRIPIEKHLILEP